MFELHRDREKRSEPFTPEDFLPNDDDGDDEITMPTEDQLEEFKRRMKKNLGIQD